MAWATLINSQGGIDGHPVDVSPCNDQANPNTGAQCAKQAVSDHDVVVVGGTALGDTGALPILQQAGIPYISDPSNPQDVTDPNSWPVVAGTAVAYGGLALLMVKDYGCKKLDAISASNIQAQQVATFESVALQSIGMTLNKAVTTPAVNPDYSPQATEVSQDGADCVMFNFAGNEMVKAVPAFRQAAPNVKIGAWANALPLTIVKELGSAANGIILSDQNYPATSTAYPQIVLYRNTVSKAYPKDPIDSAGLISWGQMNILEQAIKTISGNITASAISQALGTLTAATSGVGPVVNLTKPIGVNGYNRVFSTNIGVYTVENGTFNYNASQTPVDTLQFLKQLASQS